MNIYVFKTFAQALRVRGDLQREKTTAFVNVCAGQVLTRPLRMPPWRLMYATMEHHHQLGNVEEMQHVEMTHERRFVFTALESRLDMASYPRRVLQSLV